MCCCPLPLPLPLPLPAPPLLLLSLLRLLLHHWALLLPLFYLRRRFHLLVSVYHDLRCPRCSNSRAGLIYTCCMQDTTNGRCTTQRGRDERNTIKSKHEDFPAFSCTTVEFCAFYVWKSLVLFSLEKLMEFYDNIQLKITQSQMSWKSYGLTTEKWLKIVSCVYRNSACRCHPHVTIAATAATAIVVTHVSLLLPSSLVHHCHWGRPLLLPYTWCPPREARCVAQSQHMFQTKKRKDLLLGPTSGSQGWKRQPPPRLTWYPPTHLACGWTCHQCWQRNRAWRSWPLHLPWWMSTLPKWK